MPFTYVHPTCPKKGGCARKVKGGQPPKRLQSPQPLSRRLADAPQRGSVPEDSAMSLPQVLLHNDPPPFPYWDGLPKATNAQSPLAPDSPQQTALAATPVGHPWETEPGASRHGTGPSPSVCLTTGRQT